MTSAVGALTLPVAVDAPRLADPAVDALLGYLGAWLRSELNGALEQLGVAKTTDVCPLAARYPWDPAAHLVRNLTPSLYAWWDGKSSKAAGSTLVYTARERHLHVQFIYGEVVAPTVLDKVAGVLAAVDGVFWKASDRGVHTDYASGESIWSTLSALRFEYEGGTAGQMVADPLGDVPRKREAQSNNNVRGYPSLRGSFLLWERVGPSSPLALNQDIPIHLMTNEQGDMSDLVEIAERYGEMPDGDEPAPE